MWLNGVLYNSCVRVIWIAQSHNFSKIELTRRLRHEVVEILQVKTKAVLKTIILLRKIKWNVVTRLTGGSTHTDIAEAMLPHYTQLHTQQRPLLQFPHGRKGSVSILIWKLLRILKQLAYTKLWTKTRFEKERNRENLQTERWIRVSYKQLWWRYLMI
jgi:hypothetical protein